MTSFRVIPNALLALMIACGGTESATSPTAQFNTDDPRAKAEDVLVRDSYFPNVVVGGALPAIVDFLPQAAPDWASSDPGVASVSRSGMITGVSAGTAVIRGWIQPGLLTLTSAEGTIEVVPPFTSIDLGSIYSCGQTVPRALYCWGANGTFQLGMAVSPDICLAPCAATPHRVFSNPVLAQVALGYGMNCGLTGVGETYCWGNNQFGQLGAPPGNLADPVQLPGPARFTRIGVGRFYGCGLDGGGQGYCWGIDFTGNLGAAVTDVCGGFPCALTPVPVAGGLTFTSLSVGQLHACGLTASGDAYCWGGGVPPAGPEPKLVPGGIHFTAISAGEINTCGLSNTGAAYCWGDNSEGQVGNGIITGSPVPVIDPTPVVGHLTFASIEVGGAHVCALTLTGKAYCWGRNIHGQLGDGTTVTSGSPVAVARDLTFVQHKVRRGHSCGLTTGGQVYCWGQNFYGQLGTGKVAPSDVALVPVGVGGAP